MTTLHVFGRCLTGITLTLGLLLAAGPAVAQDEDPGSTGPQPGAPVPPTGVPIDGGASLLLAGGVAYGLKKLQKRRAR
jgi:hypothetical protein